MARKTVCILFATTKKSCTALYNHFGRTRKFANPPEGYVFCYTFIIYILYRHAINASE